MHGIVSHGSSTWGEVTADNGLYRRNVSALDAVSCGRQYATKSGICEPKHAKNIAPVLAFDEPDITQVQPKLGKKMKNEVAYNIMSNYDVWPMSVVRSLEHGCDQYWNAQQK